MTTSRPAVSHRVTHRPVPQRATTPHPVPPRTADAEVRR